MQQNINLGTPNNQDGDFVRVAFSKAQDNFTELYSLVNNTVKIKELAATSLDKSEIANLINASLSFTIAPNEIYHFIVTVSIPDSIYNQKALYKIINRNEGDYGVGGFTLTETDIELISKYAEQVDLLNDPTTQFINLGEIGSSLIEDAFNSHDFTIISGENPIQDPNADGYVVIDTFRSGTEVQYLFVGSGGAYGVNNGVTLTAIEEDFIEIDPDEEFIEADIWRDRSGTQAASSYNQWIRHKGNVALNGNLYVQGIVDSQDGVAGGRLRLGGNYGTDYVGGNGNHSTFRFIAGSPTSFYNGRTWNDVSFLRNFEFVTGNDYNTRQIYIDTNVDFTNIGGTNTHTDILINTNPINADTHYALDIKNGLVQFPHYLFPDQDGTSGQVIVTDGSGTLQWQDQLGSGGGENNTASNLGSGEGLFTSKVGLNLPFKSLIAGSNITFDVTGTDITIKSSGGGSTYTVDNGLTENVAGNFRLGGTLLETTNIDVDDYSLIIEKSIGSGFALDIDANNNTSGLRINSTATNGTGAFIRNEGVIGLQVISTTGTGVNAFGTQFGGSFASDTNSAIYARTNPTSNPNTLKRVIELENTPSDPTGIGTGLRVDGYLKSAGNSKVPSFSISSSLTKNNAFNDYDADFKIYVGKNNAFVEAFGINSDRQITLNAYGQNIFTGTAVYGLGVTATGQVVETALGGGSGSVDFVSNVATNTILGRNDVGSGNSEELTPAEVRTMLNVEDGATADQTAVDIENLLDAYYGNDDGWRTQLTAAEIETLLDAYYGDTVWRTHGSGGGSSEGKVYNEDLSSQLDGTEKVFTISNEYISGSTEVYLNGQKLTLVDDYTESGAQEITLTASQYAPEASEDLTITYATSVGGITEANNYNENLSSQADGTETVFTTASTYVSTSTRVYINGQKQTLGSDYTESGVSEITFTVAPESGEDVTISYSTSAPSGGGSGGSGNTLVPNESFTGDGTTAVYTVTQNFVSGSTMVYKGGLRMRQGATNDYTETGANEITFNAGAIPANNENVIIDYIKQ